MELKLNINQNLPVVQLDGRFDGFGATVFDSFFDKELSTVAHLIIDFKNVNFLSSAGLRSILRAEQQLRQRQGYLVLCDVDPNNMRVLEISGFTRNMKVLSSVDEALNVLAKDEKSNSAAEEIQINDQKFIVKPNVEARSKIYWWNRNVESQHSLAHSNSITASLANLEIAFGSGAFGTPFDELTSVSGELFSVNNTATLRPADGNCVTDFIQTTHPDDEFIHVISTLSFSGEPDFTVESANADDIGSEITIKDYLLSLVNQVDSLKEASHLGFLILTDKYHLNSSHYKDKDASLKNISTCECINSESDNSTICLIACMIERKDYSSKEGGCNIESFLAQNSEEIGDYSFRATLLTFKTNQSNSIWNMLIDNPIQISDYIDFPEAVAACHSDSTVNPAKVFIFSPDAISPFTDKLVSIEIIDCEQIDEESEVIVNRIYSDSSLVRMERLKGGFSANTYLVSSFDRSLRRQLPTVLKIAPIQTTNREHSAYKKHVEKFILNNSTTILGTYSHNTHSGLRYNFLGITGDDSHLTWLENIYRNEPIERILPLFDQIFKNVLKPWYGQPRLENVRLYEEHDPFRLFTSILDDAKSILNISADDETIDCPLLGRRLPNPYHFLKYIYPERRNRATQWYTSIVHGDLNMKNILVDEKDNIYIIDFSETRQSNIVSDFARLEPIFKFETFNIEDEEPFGEVLRFEERLAQTSSIKQAPSYLYSGKDMMVEKAYKAICALRGYASAVTIFEDDIVPYLLAVLEWTYPVVIYYGLSHNAKLYSAYSAALIVEKIMALEK